MVWIVFWKPGIGVISSIGIGVHGIKLPKGVRRNRCGGACTGLRKGTIIGISRKKKGKTTVGFFWAGMEKIEEGCRGKEHMGGGKVSTRAICKMALHVFIREVRATVHSHV